MWTAAVVALLLDSGWHNIQMTRHTGQWVTQHPDHQTYWTVGDTTSRSPDIPSKETQNFIPKQSVVYNSKPPPLSTQQNATIHSLATAHFLPVAVLTTIFHCRLLWCTSYKQSSRTHLNNLVLSHFHSNLNIKFCKTGRSDTKMTHWI